MLQSDTCKVIEEDLLKSENRYSLTVQGSNLLLVDKDSSHAHPTADTLKIDPERQLDVGTSCGGTPLTMEVTKTFAPVLLH